MCDVSEQQRGLSAALRERSVAVQKGIYFSAKCTKIYQKGLKEQIWEFLQCSHGKFDQFCIF